MYYITVKHPKLGHVIYDEVEFHDEATSYANFLRAKGYIVEVHYSEEKL